MREAAWKYWAETLDAWDFTSQDFFILAAFVDIVSEEHFML